MKKLNLWFKPTKLYWLVSELIKVYSNGDSYFSKKRIESSIAFIIAESGLVYFLITHVDKMDTQNIVLWATSNFLIAGYTVGQIQKEKKVDSTVDKTEP
jgi:hypothetical protein